MKQLSNEPHLLWGGVVAVFLALLVLGKSVDPDTRHAGGRLDLHADHGYTYTGPSVDYTATPHAGSLTYADAGPDR